MNNPTIQFNNRIMYTQYLKNNFLKKKNFFNLVIFFNKIQWFLWFYLKCFPRIIGTVNLTSIKSFRSWFKIFSIIYSYWRLLLEPAIFSTISILLNMYGYSSASQPYPLYSRFYHCFMSLKPFLSLFEYFIILDQFL